MYHKNIHTIPIISMSLSSPTPAEPLAKDAALEFLVWDRTSEYEPDAVAAVTALLPPALLASNAARLLAPAIAERVLGRVTGANNLS